MWVDVFGKGLRAAAGCALLGTSFGACSGSGGAGSSSPGGAAGADSGGKADSAGTEDDADSAPGGACVTAVAVGHSHACALRTDGTVWCWGSSMHDALGPGASSSEPLPRQLMALGSAVTAIVAGGPDCALKSDGTLWCWGLNTSGQLGVGSLSGGDGGPWSVAEPAQVTALGNEVASVSVGVTHACAIRTDKTLWCWGRNTNGQLGDGTKSGETCTFGDLCRSLPVQIALPGATPARVSAGAYHTCALGTDGSAWCWGENGNGQLGDGSTSDRSAPTQVLTLGSGVADIVAGESSTCAKKMDGTAWCWGDNSKGSLGQGTLGPPALTPAQVSALGTEVAAISAGCAVKSDGTLWCWGDGFYGTLGDGTIGTMKPSPTQVGVLGSGVKAVNPHCALKTDGTLWCWGLNDSGQLGDGSVSKSACKCKPLPVQVAMPCP